MNDNVWNHEGVTVSVTVVGTFIRKVQALGNVASPVVLDIDGLVREKLLQVHRQTPGDAALTQVVFE